MRPVVPYAVPRGLLVAAAAALALAATSSSSPPSPKDGPDEPWFCGSPSGAEDAPSRDLYCLDLLPTPRAGEARGTAQLAPAPSPFGAPLTRDGRFRYRLSLKLEGLPEPGTLGPYGTFVAWAAAPDLRPMIRLGEVGEGKRELRTVALNKFLVLVSAERSGDVREREGPVLLRARSPSMRMQPHSVPFAFMRGEGPRERAAGAGGATPDTAGDGTERAGSAGWTAPAMHPRVPMSPPLRAVRPSAAPFLPDAGSGERLPRARPREVVPLEDGDTLRLVAREVRRRIGGRSLVMYGFNDQVPGPLIRVPQGATITVLFRNRIGLPSTVHWHGVRLENRFDGVPGVTQEAVPPGGEFTYRVHFRDAGLYWYHPHHREDVQQDLGLYGNMLVEPRPEGEPPGAAARLRAAPGEDGFTYDGHFGPVNREEVLMLDDLLVRRTGRRVEALVPWGRDASTHALMGRFGNLLLVNGEPGWTMEVTRGEVVRFWLTNVANTRVLNLSFGDLPVKVVASDLSRLERQVRTSSVVMAPAERYLVEVRFDEAGTVPLLNRVQGLNHVYGSFFPEVDTLGTIRVRPGEPAEDHGDAFRRLEASPGVTRDIGRHRDAFDRPVDHELELTVEVDSLPFPVGPLVRRDSLYFHPVEAAPTMPRMNWTTTTDQVRWVLRDPATGKENMEIDWRFRVGDVVKIRLRNVRHATHAMQHPIHVHGQRFLVLGRNGRRRENLAWKDTAIVPSGTTATLLLELSNPGEWMLHCHIAEHLSSGMRTTFTVEPASGGGPP